MAFDVVAATMSVSGSYRTGTVSLGAEGEKEMRED